jgi:signal transduction histidine kinase
VRNGIQAMEKEGGLLTVRTRALVEGDEGGRVSSLRTERPGATGAEVRIRRGHVTADEAVEISFQDEGSGIRLEEAGKLFIPFFTTKAQGTGLGLPICERIIREHGGEIEIESLAGVGTRFTLRLPLGLEPDPAGDDD